MDVVAPAVVAVLLVVLWVTATRRQVRSRREASEWDGAAARPNLWTSSARCPACGAGGGVLTMTDTQLWFSCLACGRRHRRETKA